MLFLRKLFFYLFLIIYLIVCPLVIFYAFGFILKPGAPQALVGTGLIYLSTNPAGASIYLEDSRYARKTPAVIQELKPGEYAVRISLKDYQTWSETVKVEANKASVFDKILLRPDQWNKQEISAGTFRNLIPVIGSNFFILSRGPKIKDYFIYDLSSKQLLSLAPEGSSLAQERISACYTIPESSVFFLAVDTRTAKKFFRVKLKSGILDWKDITTLFSEVPLDLVWDPTDTEDIFSLQGNYLNLLDIDSAAVYPRYLENIRGFGLLARKIYIIQDDFVFNEMDYNKGSQNVLLKDPSLSKSIFGGRGFIRIKPLSNDIIVFSGEKGELLTNHLPYEFAAAGVLGTEFYPDNQTLLFWQKQSIGVIDFTTEDTQGTAFEKGPELFRVYERGKNIRQAFWVYEGSHVLFLDQNEVTLASLPKIYGDNSLDPVISVKKGSSVYYAEDNGTLYYLEVPSGKLFGIKIVPEQTAIQLPLPRPEEQAENSVTEAQ